VQAPRSVDDDNVLVAIDARIDGVERHGSRVRSGVAADEVRSRPLGPGAKLVDSACAKSVRRPDKGRHLIALEQVREFPYERSLAGAVDADDQDHRRRRFRLNDSGIAVSGPQRGFDRGSERAQKLILRLDQSPPRVRLDFGD